MTGSPSWAKGSLSITTSESASPATSTPSQKLAAPSSTPLPEAMKSASSAGRGRSPVGVHDIGNLASELAESEGGRSLHILVLVAGGKVNRWLPFVDDESARHQAYGAADAFDALGASALLPLAAAHPLSLIDTEALRGKSWPKDTPSELRELAWRWDRIVLVREGRAATH